MNISRTTPIIWRRHIVSILLTTFGLAGCAGRSMPEHTSSMQEGAELWSMACSHCHNIRPADQYASEQWPIIVNHMRTRAGLTRSEANTIAAFLLELRRVEEGSR